MKGFFIRLMQVVWILTTLLLSLGVAVAFTLESDSFFFLAVILIWIILLVVVQYLFYSKLNPNFLFKKQNFFTKLFVICAVLGMVLGIIVRVYESYDYKQKLEGGSDVEFFNERISEVVYRYGTEACHINNEPPKNNKEALKIEAEKLNKQGVNGLGALLVLANRDDDLGFSIRCAYYDGLRSDDFARIADISY